MQFAAAIILRHRRAVLAAVADDTEAGRGVAANIAMLTGDSTRVVADATRQIATAVVARVPGVGLLAAWLTTLYDESAQGPLMERHARVARTIRQLLAV